MKKTMALVGQIALVALVIFCIYYGMFSSFPEKVQMVIDAYYNPQIPENILIWSETFSGIFYLIISAVIMPLLIISGILSDEKALGFIVGVILFGAFFIAVYLLIAEVISRSNDIVYYYKQLLFVVLFPLGIIVSIIIALYESKLNNKKAKLGFIKPLLCCVVPLLHSYLLLPLGFTASLVTAIFFAVIYNAFCEIILIIHWSFKRLSSCQ